MRKRRRRKITNRRRKITNVCNKNKCVENIVWCLIWTLLCSFSNWHLNIYIMYTHKNVNRFKLDRSASYLKLKELTTNGDWILCKERKKNEIVVQLKIHISYVVSHLWLNIHQRWACNIELCYATVNISWVCIFSLSPFQMKKKRKENTLKIFPNGAWKCCEIILFHEYVLRRVWC